MADFEKRIVVVVKEKLEIGKAMMALAHAMLGFGAGIISKEEVRLNKYEDVEGNVHNNISEMPIVVLKASSGKIRTIRNLAKENGVSYTDFVDTMSIGTYEEEYALTKKKKDEELDYWSLILFGENDKIRELTGKLSLYK
ncbi:DUF2000 domain-containing protein [Candidatus Micrarchaeota archaeon]|nr:DUF2000 domain-containing protein [Candidatus Micrarchaeota archaeon]